jgi:uncharacterized protein YebE (UPF0316 family)
MTVDSPWWILGAVPALIFLARVLDVGVGTLRIAMVARGHRGLAPVLGFFESLIWLIAISQVVQHLDRAVHYLAWAAGYAAGTWVGVVLEEKLAFGLVAVRVITAEDAADVLKDLEGAAFDTTSVAARGLKGRVRLLFSVIRRRDLGHFQEIVTRRHPNAFVSISDVRSAKEGFGLVRPRGGRRSSLRN